MARRILVIVGCFAGIVLTSLGLIQDSWLGWLGFPLILISCAFLAYYLTLSEENNDRNKE